MNLLSAPIDEIKKIIFYRRNYAEYYKYKKEAEGYKSRLLGMQEVVQENNRLQRILEFKKSLVYESTVANVIGRNPTYWNDFLIIDQGLKRGVNLGMPVITSSGVVGKIVEVGNISSKVILLTDPNFSVAAIVQRSRQQGLLSGSLKGLCRMQYLPLDTDIKIGDMIITSKLSSAFPEGLAIGEVVNIQRDQDGSLVECLIRPSVNFAGIEEVVVIKK